MAQGHTTGTVWSLLAHTNLLSMNQTQNSPTHPPINVRPSTLRRVNYSLLSKVEKGAIEMRTWLIHDWLSVIEMTIPTSLWIGAQWWSLICSIFISFNTYQLYLKSHEKQRDPLDLQFILDASLVSSLESSRINNVLKRIYSTFSRYLNNQHQSSSCAKWGYASSPNSRTPDLYDNYWENTQEISWVQRCLSYLLSP